MCAYMQMYVCTCEEVAAQLLHVQRHLPRRLAGIQEVRHTGSRRLRAHCCCVIHAPTAGRDVADGHQGRLGLQAGRQVGR